ncbi:unnamed protein product [Rotaria sp. Silwood1]|nr:unnamed protein product [Rotaria sp. Silwood1]CAF1670727.1 unnamed protein product [Rotaria sp. Silwood1]CAF3852887.1 unnamed protein product [Rotaria sp. Silwood1]CAF3924726.1 unnamed protein product [Rotaria sp. Silwood1]CAF4978316.1 unnamed protein product [Rotaria sp. Silwood1]
MISYAWTETQDLAYEVAEQLKNENIPIWMDIRNGLGGHINDGMAEAVENSAAVCFFMTPKYQSSKSCRKELEYAEKLEIPLIPCRCRVDFKPSGWLGIISAGLLWYDFRDLSDKPVNNTMNKLIKYIQMNIFKTTPTVFPDLEGRTSPIIFRNRHQFRTIEKQSITNQDETTFSKMNQLNNEISSLYNPDFNNEQNGHRFTSSDDLIGTKQMLMPLEGYETEPIVSLEKSIESLVDLFNDDIHRYVYIAKQNTRTPKDSLTSDESAAIQLYSMQWPNIDDSLYIRLNRALRGVNRQVIIPWFSYLKLFLTALFKLLSCHKTIWRGVKGDLSNQYNKDQDIIWWGVSSCAISVSVIEQFIGQTGTRTIFSIEAINAKFIREHAYFKEEDEIILPPGTYLKVIDKIQPARDLTIIHLKEIIPPFPLVASPFNNDDNNQQEQSQTNSSYSNQQREIRSESIVKNIINQLGQNIDETQITSENK